MDIELFKELMEKRRKEKEELVKIDYAEYVAKQGKGDCVEELIKTRKNTIPLNFVPCNEDEIPVGASKSGGYPDLPPSIPFPTLCGYSTTNNSDGTVTHYNESAMQLVAQINLSEIAEYDRDDKLPKHGMLYFFWSGEIILEENRYYKLELEGENREVFKVIYYDGDMTKLKRTKPEHEYYSKYFEEPLDTKRIEPGKCRYTYDKSQLEDIFYDKDNEEIAERLMNAYENWEVDGNKLLGYFTGSMNVQEPDEEELHLFQFDYSVGCLWDIYWFIDEKALADRDFDKAYMTWDMS